MRALIVNQHISDVLDGSEIQCHNIALGLHQKRHSVIDAATDRNREKSCENEYPTFPLDVYNKKETKEFLLKHKPDVIYWRYNKHGLMGFCKPLPRCIGFVFAASHINDFKRTRQSQKITMALAC